VSAIEFFGGDGTGHDGRVDHAMEDFFVGRKDQCLDAAELWSVVD
jgi:hypothetical protein